MSSTAAESHTEDDVEWQEIIAIDADIEPVMWSIQSLRDVFSSVHGENIPSTERLIRYVLLPPVPFLTGCPVF